MSEKSLHPSLLVFLIKREDLHETIFFMKLFYMQDLLASQTTHSSQITNNENFAQFHGKTLDNNDLNQVTDWQFSSKQWFVVGAHSCRLRKTGSAHCYLRISDFIVSYF